MRVILILSLCLSFSALAAEGTYFGKYKAVSHFDSAEVEFLLNSKDEFTMTTDSWDRQMELVTVAKKSNSHSLGPDMDTLTMKFETGSDEDGIVYNIELAWLGYEGDRELKVINNLMIHVDGPNSLTNAERGAMELYKWNKKTKKYEAIPSI